MDVGRANTIPQEEEQPIRAVWESGFMSFGADFQRKYSSYLYVSMLPENNSRVTVTAVTDRRDTYMEKHVNSGIINWENINFNLWTFETRAVPKIKKTKLKVKKFVYYKLIFKVDEDRARATILGFDQNVRYGSMAK
jgi:hypothetical protein